MRKAIKLFLKIAAVLGVVYSALFAVFYFDLDGKFLYYVVEPFLCRHYDKMERRDPLRQVYETDKPRYEYPK